MIQQRSRGALFQRVGVCEDTAVERWLSNPCEQRVLEFVFLQKLLEGPYGAMFQAARRVKRLGWYHVEVSQYHQLVFLSSVLVRYL